MIFQPVKFGMPKETLFFCWFLNFDGISLIWPSPCNSDHQDYYMFSRGFLFIFTFHCYREGAISKASLQVSVEPHIQIEVKIQDILYLDRPKGVK